MWQWIKHGSTTSLWSQVGSQLSGAGESHRKRPKTQTSASKVLGSVFWDGQAILCIDYLEKRRTINSECYIALLVRLKEEIDQKRPQRKKKKVLFHKDKAPCHKSIATMTKLHELYFELLPHPPYSPDLAPSDYWLFADVKRMLQGKIFGSNEEVISETEVYFEAKDKPFCKKGIELLEKRWKETMLMNKVEFCEKVVLLVRLIEWCVIYYLYIICIYNIYLHAYIFHIHVFIYIYKYHISGYIIDIFKCMSIYNL